MQLTDLTGRVGPPFCYLGSIVDHQKFLSVLSLCYDRDGRQIGEAPGVYWCPYAV